jgi:hypothetical protein
VSAVFVTTYVAALAATLKKQITSKHLINQLERFIGLPPF